MPILKFLKFEKQTDNFIIKNDENMIRLIFPFELR